MATKTIIPRGSGEGGLGTANISWGQAYFDHGHCISLQVGGKDVLVSGDVAEYVVTQDDVTGYQSALTITESQISDLGSYITSVEEADVTAHEGALSIAASQVSGLESALTSYQSKNPDGSLDITGQINLSGHIIPAVNSQYDLGSAEYKIRHLFLSSNSLFVDDQRISLDDDKNLILPSGLKLGSNNGAFISGDDQGRAIFSQAGLLVGNAPIKPDPDNPDSIYFETVPQVKDEEGNAVTVLTADKLGLGTSDVLASANQDIQFKLLTDENRFVVGTTGQGDLASGWYRFNDFYVKGATDIGAHPINPVDTRIYSDEDSFVYMTRDAYGNRVAHLVGGDEEVSAANNIALGLSIKIDESDTPQDIEFIHTDGESYSLINGDSDNKGVNGLPIRQGFQNASIGGVPSPLLIDGGYF